MSWEIITSREILKNSASKTRYPLSGLILMFNACKRTLSSQALGWLLSSSSAVSEALGGVEVVDSSS